MTVLSKIRENVEGLFHSGGKPAADPSSREHSQPAHDDADHDAQPGFLSKLGHFLKNPKDAVYQARLDVKGRQEGVLGDAHQVSNKDIVMEQLAHAGAYGALDPSKLGAWGYHEAGAVEDPESGFRAVLYMPTNAAPDSADGMTARAIHGGAPKPVLAFRGTANKRGVSDDTNREGIGSYQFASNQAKIQALMKAAGGKCTVVGHSLGGALAQQAAAAFPGGVSSIVTFQSPGVNKETAEKLRKHNEEAAPEDRISSTHHRASGDLVHLAGEALTDGDVFTYESVGIGNAMDHTKFPLARLAAARGNLIPGVNDGGKGATGDRLVRVEHTTTAQEKSGLMPKVSEAARKSLGGAARDKDMEPYVKTWGDVQQMASSGDFSPGYVRGIIKDSDQLTDVQKDKMMLQFGGLYD
jgi:pimeloyl-ACP methyl ester carboxylesterase